MEQTHFDAKRGQMMALSALMESLVNANIATFIEVKDYLITPMKSLSTTPVRQN
jgi:hypothetical protein